MNTEHFQQVSYYTNDESIFSPAFSIAMSQSRPDYSNFTLIGTIIFFICITERNRPNVPRKTKSMKLNLLDDGVPCGHSVCLNVQIAINCISSSIFFVSENFLFAKRLINRSSSRVG